MAENILKQEFKTTAPNQVWVSDISYVPTDEGWLYIAGHKDLYHGGIVGYALSGRMTKNLVSESLFRAVAGKRPGKGLTHHSDRGSQYCAYEYRERLEQFGMQTSFCIFIFSSTWFKGTWPGPSIIVWTPFLRVIAKNL